MQKTVLLTGHTGFLGAKIYKDLEKNFKVLTIGRSHSSDLIVNFSDWDGLLDIPENVFAIVHVAGLAHNKANSQNELQNVNVESVKKLCLLATKHKIKSFVFISSVAVYGADFGLNIDETSKLSPKSPYGRSKIDAETLIRKWGEKSNNKFINLRLPLIIGPNPPGNLRKLITSISSGNHIFLKGNKALKSIVLASDVSRFISQWLMDETRKSGSVNLCNNIAPTFNWIENTVRESVNGKYRAVVPIKLLFIFLVGLRSKIGVSVPAVGKLLYSLTFSDNYARKEFNYKSTALNQTTFINELNSNY